MAIRSHIDAESSVIVHVADGALVADEMIAAFDTVASDPLFQSDVNVLVTVLP
jgi:hypothetical protein